ncbi:serine dehydratase [Slackia equolifaciens]|uniref:L-serine dehydratase n=3 Tax=Slackia equolifaciens TaxID=498718 RepID=A0A3N0AYF2_9ACTN|nr:L-serine ammonia-lyase, iron-sulfur-dependent, subunit alpha [Slackia equolifaciens]RNL39905.1 serine dehydratase [Slackia equolifaciens]
MKSLSIRDIIGPVMIGPSSSHTAGALRIARMCRRLLSAEPVRAVFTLYGSFAHTYQGHGTDRALVAGMLGMEPDDERIRDSFALAEEAGLSFAFIPCDDDSDIGHPNTVDIEVVDASGGVTSMRGESIGGGAAVISRLNGIDVSLTGEYHSIVVKQYDRRGVLAHIATCLNVFDVNIATTRLFRKKKGDIAYTIMQTDDKIPAELAAAVARHADILDVRVVESDRASETGAPVAAECAEAQGFGAGMSVAEAEEMLESLDFANGAELLAYCEAEDLPISDAICRRERCLLAAQGIAVDDTKHYLHRVLDVMRTSATRPLDAPQPSMGGLIGGEAQKLAAIEKTGLANPLLARATTYAMAVLETNASMGCIVAAPTAGSSGVLPAMLLACQDVHGFDDDRLERALANAAAIGYLITRNATVSGAEGGCQAEVGAASAMAASAACELMGGTPRQCFAAASNALTGLMGLVCDPIAGLVEAPCQKRNATGVANAIVAAQIALAGIDNLVDFDQTVEAMRRVGCALPFELRESALGGLAATPAACAFCGKC